MTKEIKTEILINATPEKIWGILTSFGEYPWWNPFITLIQGTVEVGNKITVRIEPPESKAMIFKPRVLTYIPNKKLQWLGHLLIAGIFDGEHTFELDDQGNGSTIFKHSEIFKGILVPLLKNQLDNNTRRGFEEMNKKLKELAEKA
ncbi:SRPBCC domain-containing protein [Thermophagus xiamenensis]|uniref:Polyketide cyclase / dehydrase and lipid transport n=1 Tax=Thermophagus xiamenensis TaxID=385682 RepID=A0A1I1VS07_9BACT|nr:SRPBCC domain-containing protein [Thermophagus xiamenensis]SFD85614.1 hypothetical protein SAMN05444380_10332 [Thermophagus xiamenensis]